MNNQQKKASIELDARIVFAIATQSLEHMVEIGSLGEFTVLMCMERYNLLAIQNKPYGKAVIARAKEIEKEARERLAEEGRKLKEVVNE